MQRLLTKQWRCRVVTTHDNVLIYEQRFWTFRGAAKHGKAVTTFPLNLYLVTNDRRIQERGDPID